jgi:hypothetical protein
MTISNEVAVREGVVVTPADRAAAASAAVREGSIDSWLIVMKDVMLLAEYICATEFVPAAYRNNAPAAAAAILAGRELGLQPMTALRHVQVVKGSPGLSAEYKRARVLAAGHRLDITEHTAEACTVTGHRKGHQPVTVRYTIGEARIAKLVKPDGAYMTRPRRMLFARACTEVVDALFADLTNGLATAELLESGEEGDAQAAIEAAPAVPQRPTAERIRARRPQPATATALTPDPSPAPDAPPASAAPPPQQGAGEDPTTSGASSSAPAPDSASPAQTAAPSPSTSGGSATVPDERTGTVTSKQITAIWARLTKEFGFSDSDAEKDQARLVCAHIVQHDLKSTTMLSQAEASKILDELKDWQYGAEQEGVHPRDYMLGLIASQDPDAQGEVPGGE